MKKIIGYDKSKQQAADCIPTLRKLREQMTSGAERNKVLHKYTMFKFYTVVCFYLV